MLTTTLIIQHDVLRQEIPNVHNLGFSCSCVYMDHIKAVIYCIIAGV